MIASRLEGEAACGQAPAGVMNRPISVGERAVQAVYFAFVLSIPVETINTFKTYVQPARTRTSEQFRKATRGIMFSSDVTARGLDYPDVTLVLQVNIVVEYRI